jgi:hypothetical protein
MYLGDYWLEFIEEDIEKKYGVKNPLFVVHKRNLERNDVIHWIDHIVKREHQVKYKYLSENYFELKGFFPDPPHEVCVKFVQEILQAIDNYDFPELAENKQEKIFYQLSAWNEFFTKKQIRKMLFFALRSGSTSMSLSWGFFASSCSKKKRFIVRIDAMEAPMHIQMQEGLVVLEYKD